MMKIDHYVLKPEHDGRVKLTEDDKKEIKRKFELGASKRQLSREFGVSRRLIQFILDPSVHERNKELHKKKAKDGRYYDRKKHGDAVRKLRAKKKELLLKGELVCKTSN